MHRMALEQLPFRSRRRGHWLCDAAASGDVAQALRFKCREIVRAGSCADRAP
jgi:hypothetical protein